MYYINYSVFKKIINKIGNSKPGEELLTLMADSNSIHCYCVSSSHNTALN